MKQQTFFGEPLPTMSPRPGRRSDLSSASRSGLGLHLAYPMSQLRPAPYNPRQISSEATSKLARSLADLGILVPLISTRGGTIVAGHQRHSALLRLGVNKAPVFVVDDLDHEDEVRFNQIHNGADTEVSSARVDLPANPAVGEFFDVPPDSVRCSLPQPGASQRNLICRLIARHGPFGAVVVDSDGAIIRGTDYAVSCRIMRAPVRVMVAGDPLRAAEALGASYGEFCYESIPRAAWVQTFAQIKRMRGGGSRATSPAYQMVAGMVEREAEDDDGRAIEWSDVLDFGAGQGDAASRYGADQWEPYRRARGTDRLDVEATEQMAMALCERLHDSGRYGVVIVDYVLNSVQTQAEHDAVILAAKSLCRVGGLIVLSGRRMEFVDKLRERYAKRAGRSIGRCIEFPDRLGFTALWRKGAWFFQRFHRVDELRSIARAFFDDNSPELRLREAEWLMVCRSNGAVDDGAVESEFSMAWQDGGRMPYGRQVAEAVARAAEKERA